MKLVATFQLERETKGAVRYQEIDAAGQVLDMINAKIGTLYLRKAAMGGAMPKNLTVTIDGAA